MKIKGKEIKEYFMGEGVTQVGISTTRVLKGEVEGLEKDIEECLDNLVLELQTQAYEMEKSRKQGTPVFIETQLMYYHQSRAYLEVVREINEKFGTNYSNNIKKIIKHFETKTPAKDD